MPMLNSHHPSRDMRFMPDFVVTSAKSGDLFYLEVKFRDNGCFEFDEKYADYPYKNAWFVVVSPEKIQCMHYKRLKAGFAITPDTHYRITGVKSFHISKESVAEGYANGFFAAFNRLKAEG